MELLIELCRLLLKLYAAYAAVISLLALIPVKKYARCKPKKRFAIVIAARDEERVIGSTVKQLLRQDYPAALYDIYVIPNNCTDHTAQAAERAGARVAKGAQRALNPEESWIAGCYDLYFENFNLLYSRPRSRLKLSAKLMGTGFAVSRTLLEEMGGFHTGTLTEDTEFAVQCAIHGEKVWWVPEAVTYDEQPNAFSVTVQQRRRWSSGVVSVGRKYASRLLRGMKGSPLLCFDLLMMLLGPVTQTVALLPAAAMVWLALAKDAWLPLAAAVLSYWLGMTLMALGLCLFGRRKPGDLWRAILLYPLFLASWYPISVWSVIRPAKVWKTIAHGQGQRASIPDTRMICMK